MRCGWFLRHHVGFWWRNGQCVVCKYEGPDSYTKCHPIFNRYLIFFFSLFHISSCTSREYLFKFRPCLLIYFIQVEKVNSRNTLLLVKMHVLNTWGTWMSSNVREFKLKNSRHWKHLNLFRRAWMCLRSYFFIELLLTCHLTTFYSKVQLKLYLNPLLLKKVTWILKV